MGFLTKDASREDILRSLEAAVAGQAVLDAGVQAALVRAAGPGATTGAPAAGLPTPLPDGLTTREGEVLSLVAAGLSNTEIAARLFLGEATVKTHINRIFAKTASRDRAKRRRTLSATAWPIDGSPVLAGAHGRLRRRS